MIVPATEAELAAAVREAAGPLRVQGGGTREDRAEGEVLSTAGLSGMRLYEPGALTLVAGAGTPVAEVEAALRAENQHLPFEPMDHRELLGTEGTPTIGGVVAMNVSGPRRVQAGACRDALIGLRFVDGTGAVVKNGGRVMKNVTGYDLVRLLAGSRGTLGVLTEVAFKVLPAPAATRTVVLEGLAPEPAVAAMASALGSPFEVAGAAHLTGEAETWLRVEGSELSVDYRAGRLAERLAEFGSARIEAGADWRAIRDCAAFSGTEREVWRISVRPSDGARVVAALGSGARTLLDWGGGLVWAEVAPGHDVRTAMEDIPGHATVVRASEATRGPVTHPEAPAVARLSALLRARFDPRGILNPGLIGSEA